MSEDTPESGQVETRAEVIMDPLTLMKSEYV